MTTIKVHGDRLPGMHHANIVTLVDVDPNEGTRTWNCTCGALGVAVDDRIWETLSDVINAAEVHLEYTCKR